MLHRFRWLLTGMCVLLLGGVVLAQGGYITAAQKRQRSDKIRALVDQLLETRNTEERVRFRDQMLALDAFKDRNGTVIQNGAAIPHFVYLYKRGRQKDRVTGQTDLNARLQAAIGLSSINHPNAPGELGNMLGDESPAVRLRVLKAIYDNSIIRAWEQVIPQLGDPNPEIQGWAAKTLGRLKQGADGKATEQLTILLVKTWRELEKTDKTQVAERAELNSLLETVGRSLELLTGIEWKPGPETAQLGTAIEPFTRAWNQKHSPALKDPRIGERRGALETIELTADRSVASQLIEFMVQERQRWINAPQDDRRQHIALIIRANVMLEGISGMDSPLSTTSSADEVATTVKRWTDWWQNEVKKMTP